MYVQVLPYGDSFASRSHIRILSLLIRSTSHKDLIRASKEPVKCRIVGSKSEIIAVEQSDS